MSAPTQFRKKPVVISAIQWTGENLIEVIHFTDGRPPNNKSSHSGMMWDQYVDLVRKDGLKIFTLEGKMDVSIGDWVIRGVKGEHYPCKPEIFALTYEVGAVGGVKMLRSRLEAERDAAVAEADSWKNRALHQNEVANTAEARAEAAETEAEFFKGEVKLRNRIPSTNDTNADLLRRAEKAEAELTSANARAEHSEKLLCRLLNASPVFNRDSLYQDMKEEILALRDELDGQSQNNLALGEKAELLAEAMKLPEVAALVEAIAECQAALTDFSNMYPQMVKGFMVDAENSATAALAPFTAVKETP